jgi:hypothetical protein
LGAVSPVPIGVVRDLVVCAVAQKAHNKSTANTEKMFVE